MSKHTTTMNEYIQSELQKMGRNEFYNAGRLTMSSKKYAFIQKILRYDKDVQCITDEIFQGFKLQDDKVDKLFKKTFIQRFLDREINRQTIEAFSSQVLYVTLTHEEYIYNVFSAELNKFLQNHVLNKSEDLYNALTRDEQNQQVQENIHGKDHNTTITDSTSDTTGNEKNQTKGNENSKVDGTSKHREATATLPQSQQNLNLNSDTMAYADQQTGANDKTTQDTTSHSDSDSNTDSKSKTTGNTKTVSDGTNDSDRHSNTDQHATQNQDSKSNHDEITVTYDLDNLEQMFKMKEAIFDVYDKKCFLQIW